MIKQNEYQGFFAEFYDILHAEQSDINAYIEFGNKYGNDILELGSGTGRLLIPLVENGFMVTGLELNEDMINICNKKLKEIKMKDNAHIIRGTMTNFNLNRKFDLIIAPCNVINHLLNENDFSDMLNCVKRHLKKDGVFIIDNSIPDIKMLSQKDGVEEQFKFVNPINNNIIIDKFTAKYDYVNQIEYNHIRLEEYHNDELVRTAETNEKLVYYFPREIRNHLKYNNFTIVEERGALLSKGRITEKSNEMVFICKVNNKTLIELYID